MARIIAVVLLLSGCAQKLLPFDKTVAEVNACTIDQCRVTFEDGTRKTVAAPVSVGDRIVGCITQSGKVYNLVMGSRDTKMEC